MNDPHELAELYALDALDPAEGEEFEEHLARCARCRAIVQDTRDVMADLAQHQAVEPPATLRGSLLEAVAAEPPADARDRPVTDLARERESRRPRAGRLAAAAAAVLAVIGGYVAWTVVDDDSSSPTAETSYSEIMEADDHQVVRGTTTDGGRIEVVMSHQEGRVMVVARGMRPAPPGKAYQVWTIDRTPTPAGMLAGTDDGEAMMGELPGEAMHAPIVAVTVEPEGGSKQPTSDPIAVVKLA